jgi:hypothetical protein
MLFIDRLISGGVRFVLDKVATAVDAELNDASRLRDELLHAQMQFELGQIGEDELALVEGALMSRLRELREQELARTEGEDLVIGGADISIDLSHGERFSA